MLHSLLLLNILHTNLKKGLLSWKILRKRKNRRVKQGSSIQPCRNFTTNSLARRQGKELLLRITQYDKKWPIRAIRLKEL